MSKFIEFERSILPFLSKYSQRYIWETLRTEAQVKDVLSHVLKSPGEHGVPLENIEEFRRAIKDVLDFKFSQSLIFAEPRLYTYGKIKFPAHTPFDSLAHAFSLTNAPIGATRENFYYPVAANVSRMFNILGGGNSPVRTSIIFNELDKDSSNATRLPIVISTDSYLLGSALPGQGTEEKAQLQRKRCDWMHEITKNPAFANSKTSDINPQGIDRSGQLFGHCAETYAFILKLYQTDPEMRKNLAGFSLRVGKINRIPSWEGLFSDYAREKCVHNPCLNCMNQIIKYHDADPAHFMVQAKDFFKFR